MFPELVFVPVYIRCDRGIILDRELKKLMGQARREKRIRRMLSCLYGDEKTLTVREGAQGKIFCPWQKNTSDTETQDMLSYYRQIRSDGDREFQEQQREILEMLASMRLTQCELKDVRKRIAQYETEEKALSGCEERYQQKLEQIHAEENEILQKEIRLEQMNIDKTELQEAMDAGNLAMAAARSVYESLSMAERWGTRELSGGSLISDVVKYNHMETAQKRMENLQVMISRFRTQLSEFQIQEKLHVSIYGFRQYADIFPDNLFPDQELHIRVKMAKEQVMGMEKKIDHVIAGLKAAKLSLLDWERKIEKELNHWSVAGSA